MIAIIPARGGSKGLPGKNIRDLNGIPLIAHTIEAALKSKKISRVILSTDCERIANIGKQFGAEVPFFRPAHLASDTARAIDTYIHTLDELLKNEGLNVKEVIVLQPTSPFRTFIDIDNSINLFYEKNADSVISFCEEIHPVTWHKYLNDDGSLVPIFKENIRNRQEERKSYFPNGAIYVFKRSILEAGKYYTPKTYAYIMSRESSVDIDTLEDFEYAEFLASKSK
jgi:CMP-N,N'-diacetyllegionaminic acid synthase